MWRAKFKVKYIIVDRLAEEGIKISQTAVSHPALEHTGYQVRTRV